MIYIFASIILPPLAADAHNVAAYICDKKLLNVNMAKAENYETFVVLPFSLRKFKTNNLE